jgi:5,5'-dehydrodivanillate O-demethylase
MLTQEENELLTRVGPGTPGGELLRRYWHVVAAASELTEEKPKKKIKVLGEDLVLYRDRRGNYGLVAEHCAHRGASLYYGFVEEDGIRCAYHGWKYDACGKCLEQPFESPEAGFKEKISQPAYPVEK